MKKILTIAVACAGLMSFTACSDFLDEDPRSELVTESFFQTQAQAEGAVNNLYRTGAMNCYTDFGSAYVNTFASLPEELTGYFSNSYENQEIQCKYSRLLTRQDHTIEMASKMDGIWDNCYKGINRANSAIKYIPNIKIDEEGEGERLLAEAKFFRAFNYFYLVKTFGAVPFYTEPYEVAENMELERTETSTIYTQIENDLNEAMAVLADARFTDNHRITKHTAAMVLTDVYMYQHKYAEAAKTAQSIIDSQKYSLLANTDKADNSAYNQLRELDNNSEVIYSYEFDPSISPSNWLPTYAFSSSATAVFDKYAIFERTHGPIKRYLNIYEDNDLRIQPKQFFVWEYTNPTNNKTWSSEDAGCWFYYDEDAMLNTGKGGKDWNIYRYAETLLDAAESIAQSTGVTADAARYLAEIKARANMDGKTVDEIAADLQTLGKQAFIEECWNERLREMPLEFKMWDLCVRVGKFPNISDSTKGQITWVDLVGATNAAGATIKETDLLWPISVNEIQRNPNLEQNPGYARE